MSVYIIADIEIKDEAAYREYQALVPATIEMYGGKYLVRGGEATVVEGDWATNRVVVLEFPDAETAQRWATSPEYAPVAEIRHRAANSKAIIVEGV
ncbi:MAG: DUF1330 domain-containing protein [Dehalococcoidia bacterium]|nr:DUF1330 domain-containing protein [Dehalococcoidia bacterium]